MVLILPKLVQYFYEWGIALGGLAVFIVLIIAGFQYLTSVGDPTKMKEAMDRIESAFLGLVLLLGSWLILNTINPELTTLRLPPTDLAKIGQLECNCPEDIICPDCPEPKENYQCVGDKDPSNNTKEGVCKRTEEKRVTCAKAEIFTGLNYSGDSTSIQLDDTIDYPALSVKAYATSTTGDIDCCSDEAYEKGYYGCGCYLQVFAGRTFLWWGCSDMTAIVPACEKDISGYLDKSVTCVKLISSPSYGE